MSKPTEQQDNSGTSPDVGTWRKTTLASSLKKMPQRKSGFTTLSGIPIDDLYTDPRDGSRGV